MTRDELLIKIDTINMWKSNDKRAPHKPLLILYALSELMISGKEFLIYGEVENALKYLLSEFGPPRKVYHPEYPFVRLTNDGVWNVSFIADKKDRTSKWLRDKSVYGGFSKEVLDILNEQPDLIDEVITRILYKNFPLSIHNKIINVLNLEFDSKIEENDKYYITKVRARDSKFRKKVLLAYEHSCAICNYSINMNDYYIGLEAAHIKWHQANGPDIENNGLALCSIHHTLFDNGAFTIDDAHRLKVSSHTEVNESTNNWLYRHNNICIFEPNEAVYSPKDIYLEWHNREVFKG